MAENRNLFRLTRFVLLKLPKLFRFFAKFRPTKKRLLIVKIDAIGDYILFRNFIEIVKTSEQYKDYQIDLLGNTLWKDLALKYDSAFISQFIFTPTPVKLYYQPWRAFKLGWRLFRNNYGVVLNPVYTRNFITDGLVALTAGKEIIGFEGDLEGILPKYKAKTDKFYTHKLILPQNIYFEFERTRFFFESVLGETISLKHIDIPTGNADRKGIIVFPGAGVARREWGSDNFAALIRLIKQQGNQPVYLAGGPGEIALGEALEAALPAGSVINRIGKSSLTGLIDMIASATLVIANDTSAIHIAVATHTPSVCILGGGHFDRFVPYPQYFEHRPVCVYHKMECYYCNWNCIYKPADDGVYPCIAEVGVDAVWQEVALLLPQ